VIRVIRQVELVSNGVRGEYKVLRSQHVIQPSHVSEASVLHKDCHEISFFSQNRRNVFPEDTANRGKLFCNTTQ